MKRRIVLAAAAMLLAICSSARASDAWLPVRDVSLELGAGSPLDFSSFLPNATIDADHRLVAGADGRLAFVISPEKPERMLCASLAWSPASGGFPDHDTADRYARQLAMRGYNLARLHFVDGSLMFGRDRDFDFDPETLDRIHYLLAALKRNGIYWMMDGLSSLRGVYGGFDDRWDDGGNLKLELFVDDRAFDHWKRMQEAILGRVNPYTGVAPIRDDALAVVILANENGMEFDTVVHDRPGKAPYDLLLAKPFNDWLAKRYGSTEALAKAWRDLRSDETIEARSVELPSDRYVDSPRLRDLQAFFIETERDTTARMSEVLRRLGYRGLISNYNNWPTVQASLSRRGLDAVTMNTYHDWVSGYAPGSKTTQTSSIRDGVSYIRMIAAARWLGRPFVISEYDHLFWNRYRYEAGLAMPAYAALQGWDALCRHGHGPIVLSYGEPFPHKKAMLPYAIALDPVARAGETLSALLYRRGDVATSDVTVPFAVRGEKDLSDDMQAREPEHLTDLALLGRIGLEDANRLGKIPAVMQPRLEDSEGILENLRQSGALASNNGTSIDAGIYQSSTGEILLNRFAGQLRVATAATEAVAFSSLREPIDLGVLRIEGADGNGLVALSALDAQASLARSRRFLLIFATDAQNTDMTFRDTEEKVIEDFGRLPVRIRDGYVDLALARTAETWSVSPVGLDGKVHAAVAEGKGDVTFRLSNDVPSGPTTYFLLELR
ncbi:MULTISPECIES: glycoside hydrolase [unclassified Ensifer]|uniref:glycoside hydrolase n=1 Tax=unclassified Ensifer TaxID=2633371 RepID=UPI000812D012|nr:MULTISPECIES: glycoside hydrolase [unclassified Ensifer]OCO99184.1 glycoside hydrolase [Ensifer sp. LC11]OCO99390.1 glycoside hydrolase [Ensifer sp. LC13]OCP12862.1 glycoside hydrolase [Ensifer sp. LC14]OCP29572.1 glycoside hydrolase [Ensifer sp. LC499]